eukprot:m.351321 g.351321  ORF g.351321 m.351321 type:complete len:120 (-) comp16222_c0_seq1:112-471(-)
MVLSANQCIGGRALAWNVDVYYFTVVVLHLEGLQTECAKGKLEHALQMQTNHNSKGKTDTVSRRLTQQQKANTKCVSHHEIQATKQITPTTFHVSATHAHTLLLNRAASSHTSRHLQLQ